MNTVKVRKTEIGSGKPKVITPIVGKSAQDVLDKAKSFVGTKIEMCEWRVDFYEDVFNTPAVLDTLKKVRGILGDMPIIFTFRTQKEGGELPIEMADYTALNTAVAQSGDVDIIDVEIFSGDDVVNGLIGNIHAAGAYVIGSNHDFHKTPDEDDLVSRLRKMQDMGADLLKIAVMPKSTRDVITLLSATENMYTNYAKQPLVTMSMSATGVISRLSGEAFGSAISFGALGQTSAPGQIPVDKLSEVLEILHNSMN